jgi:hypothetical protein
MEDQERIVEHISGLGLLMASDSTLPQAPRQVVRYFVTVFQDSLYRQRLVVDFEPLITPPSGSVTLRLQDNRRIEGTFQGQRFEARGPILPR